MLYSARCPDRDQRRRVGPCPEPSPETPLTVAVVGATGAVGRTMIQVLHERDSRSVSSGCSPPRARPAGARGRRPGARGPARRRPTRSRASTSRCSPPVAARPRRSRPRRRARRHGHRQLQRVAHGARRPARREPGQSRTTPRSTRASSPTRTAPRCSSCRCSWRCVTAVGLERVVVDTYQSVSVAPATRRSPSSRRRSRAHAAGQPKQAHRLPAPDRLQRPPRDRRVPRRRLRPRRSGRSSRRAARSCTCPTCASSCTAVRGPGVLRPHARRSTSRRASPSRRTGRASCSPRCHGVVVQDDPAGAPLPTGHGRRRHRRHLRRPGPPGRLDPDGRGLSLWVVSRQPPQGRRDERGPDRRGARAARLGPGGGPRAPRRRRNGWPRASRDRCRAPRGARGGGRRGPRRAPDAGFTRAGPRPSRARVTRTPRWCSWARGRASTRTARAGRSWAGPAACSCSCCGRSAGRASRCTSRTS